MPGWLRHRTVQGIYCKKSRHSRSLNIIKASAIACYSLQRNNPLTGQSPCIEITSHVDFSCGLKIWPTGAFCTAHFSLSNDLNRLNKSFKWKGGLHLQSNNFNLDQFKTGMKKMAAQVDFYLTRNAFLSLG